jgi:hypothetical protein
MIAKIKEIVLYTGLCPNGKDCYEAYRWMAEKVGVDKFNHLHYNDPSAEASVLRTVSAWWAYEENPPKFTQFPMVTYIEYDTEFNYTQRYLYGLDDIIESTLSQLAKL